MEMAQSREEVKNADLYPSRLVPLLSNTPAAEGGVWPCLRRDIYTQHIHLPGESSVRGPS